LGAPLVGDPLQTNEGRIFASTRTALSCFSCVGVRKWTFPLASEPRFGPVLSPEGGPALALADGTFLAVSPFGEERFSVKEASPILALSRSGDSFALSLEDGTLIFLDGDGKELSRAGLSSPLVALAPLSSGSSGCFVGLSRGGEVSAFGPGGRTLWSRSYGEDKPEALKTREGRIFLLSKSLVQALDAEGNFLRKILLEHAHSLPEVSPSGIVYSGGEDWILYAYRFDDPRPERSERFNYGLSEARYPWTEWDLGFSDEGYRGILLDGFEKSLKSGTIGSEETTAFGTCATIALEEIDKVRARTLNPERRTTLARSRACFILGAMGSLEAKPILARVLAEDPETAVRAQAARALGALGADPDGAALSYFRELFEGKGRIREEQFAQAVVDAIEAIVRFEGGRGAEEALPVLLSIAESPYKSPLRSKAMAVIKWIGAVRR
jgi:hypothetical protein